MCTISNNILNMYTISLLLYSFYVYTIENEYNIQIVFWICILLHYYSIYFMYTIENEYYIPSTLTIFNISAHHTKFHQTTKLLYIINNVMLFRLTNFIFNIYNWIDCPRQTTI